MDMNPHFLVGTVTALNFVLYLFARSAAKFLNAVPRLLLTASESYCLSAVELNQVIGNLVPCKYSMISAIEVL